MLVHSLWDQEDIYGAPAVYRAIKPLDKDGDKVFMVLGPWHHGQEIEDAASLGAIRFGSDTGTWFRLNVLRPFLDHYLKDDAPADSDVAKVTAFETGVNRWQKLDAWPVAPAMKPLYLKAGFKLGFEESGVSGASGASRQPRPTPLTPLPSTNTFPIRPNRCRFAPGPASRSAMSRLSRGRSGWWTISAKPRAVPMC